MRANGQDELLVVLVPIVRDDPKIQGRSREVAAQLNAGLFQEAGKMWVVFQEVNDVLGFMQGVPSFEFANDCLIWTERRNFRWHGLSVHGRESISKRGGGVSRSRTIRRWVWPAGSVARVGGLRPV